ncbi:hypothetical protein [Paludibaculum fermentans]|uniref:Uncharacterized protein n=1 Tax=Paludibaculum fermentans TaxID=1473598 RepID=A0A7S7SLB0_PALFE|nr:hypothetical protein [Paludibaculum fermentans]QOY90067.1 hypothetical protein IRI77_08965 [Paludibaculum fermentans]
MNIREESERDRPGRPPFSDSFYTLIVLRVSVVLMGALALMMTACSSSVPSTPVSDSASSTAPVAPVVESAGDALLREEKQKLEDIRRAYENCKDVGDYALIMKLARARRIELDVMIRRVQKMRLSPEEHERILNPLRQERDWHLQVIHAASAM